MKCTILLPLLLLLSCNNRPTEKDNQEVAIGLLESSISSHHKMVELQNKIIGIDKTALLHLEVNEVLGQQFEEQYRLSVFNNKPLYNLIDSFDKVSQDNAGDHVAFDAICKDILDTRFRDSLKVIAMQSDTLAATPTIAQDTTSLSSLLSNKH